MNKKPEKKNAIKELVRKYREGGRFTEWCRNNPDKVKKYNKNRQEKNHNITNKEWDTCKIYFNNCCAYCGLPIEEHLIKRKNKIINMDFHKEHVVYGGKDNLKNCVPSCGTCNSEKWEYSLNTWYNQNNPIHMNAIIKSINGLNMTIKNIYKKEKQKENILKRKILLMIIVIKPQ